jgi:hypothetical protein
MFIGSAPHLLIGLIPWLIGSVLITLGAKKAWLVLMIGLVSIGGGALWCYLYLSMRRIIRGLLFLAVYAFGVIFVAATRTILDTYKKMVHRPA